MKNCKLHHKTTPPISLNLLISEHEWMKSGNSHSCWQNRLLISGGIWRFRVFAKIARHSCALMLNWFWVTFCRKSAKHSLMCTGERNRERGGGCFEVEFTNVDDGFEQFAPFGGVS